MSLPRYQPKLFESYRPIVEVAAHTIPTRLRLDFFPTTTSSFGCMSRVYVLFFGPKPQLSARISWRRYHTRQLVETPHWRSTVINPSTPPCVLSGPRALSSHSTITNGICVIQFPRSHIPTLTFRMRDACMNAPLLVLRQVVLVNATDLYVYNGADFFGVDSWIPVRERYHPYYIPGTYYIFAFLISR